MIPPYEIAAACPLTGRYLTYHNYGDVSFGCNFITVCEIMLFGPNFDLTRPNPHYLVQTSDYSNLGGTYSIKVVGSFKTSTFTTSFNLKIGVVGWQVLPPTPSS